MSELAQALTGDSAGAPAAHIIEGLNEEWFTVFSFRFEPRDPQQNRRLFNTDGDYLYRIIFWKVHAVKFSKECKIPEAYS